MIFAFSGAARIDGVSVKRKDLLDMAYSAGHYVATDVNALTDYLVINERAREKNKGLKIKAARKHKTPMLTPKEFKAMMETS